MEQLLLYYWVIWSERNKILWNGGTFHPQHMASWATTLLEDYQKHHPPKVKNKCRPASHWDPPPSGRLKVNIDGAFCPNQCKGGLGVIVRNENGDCIAAMHRSLPFISSAFQAEAEACRIGLLMAIQHGWDNILLETDCSALNTALANLEVDLSDVGCIVKDCREYLKNFASISVSHIYREANGVAHRLARLASFSAIDKV
jgi:ribonuclease HI